MQMLRMARPRRQKFFDSTKKHLVRDTRQEQEPFLAMDILRRSFANGQSCRRYQPVLTREICHLYHKQFLRSSRSNVAQAAGPMIGARPARACPARVPGRP